MRIYVIEWETTEQYRARFTRAELAELLGIPAGRVGDAANLPEDTREYLADELAGHEAAATSQGLQRRVTNITARDVPVNP